VTEGLSLVLASLFLLLLLSLQSDTSAFVRWNVL
jgi:hypothetical protein